MLKPILDFQLSHLNTDEMGRQSAIFQEDYLKPNVSDYLVKNGFNPQYPKNANMAVCISHDVDSLYYYPNLIKKYEGGWSSILNLVKHQLKCSVFKNTYTQKRQINEAYKLENLIDIHNKFDIKSTYYFLSLLKHEQDYNYHVSEIKNLFELLKNNNCEIGLHGGHLAYNNIEKINQEKALLKQFSNANIAGYRNHYLKFDALKTWQYLEANNFKYDTTYGFFDHIGFKSGFAHPFKPLWKKDDRNAKIVELPLLVMDGTLFHYMNLSESKALYYLAKLLENVANVNGVFTLLWHNSYLNAGQQKTYIKILELIHSFNPWYATGYELVEHYEKHNYFETMYNILDGK